MARRACPVASPRVDQPAAHSSTKPPNAHGSAAGTLPTTTCATPPESYSRAWRPGRNRYQTGMLTRPTATAHIDPASTVQTRSTGAASRSQPSSRQAPGSLNRTRSRSRRLSPSSRSRGEAAGAASMSAHRRRSTDAMTWTSENSAGTTNTPTTVTLARSDQRPVARCAARSNSQSSIGVRTNAKAMMSEKSRGSPSHASSGASARAAANVTAAGPRCRASALRQPNRGQSVAGSGADKPAGYMSRSVMIIALLTELADGFSKY